MSGDKAREIVKLLREDNQIVDYVDIEKSEVALHGIYTIEELHAVLYLMEYTD